MADIDVVKQKYEMLREAMDERMSRLWAASEALTSGWGGISSVAKATEKNEGHGFPRNRYRRSATRAGTILPPAQER